MDNIVKRCFLLILRLPWYHRAARRLKPTNGEMSSLYNRPGHAIPAPAHIDVRISLRI